MKLSYKSIFTAVIASGMVFVAPRADAYLGDFEQQSGYWVGSSSSSGEADIPDGGLGEQYGSNTIVPPSREWFGEPAGNTSDSSGHGPDVTRYNAGAFGTNNGGLGGTAIDIADSSGLWKQVAGGTAIANTATGPGDLAKNYIIAYDHYSGSRVLDVMSISGDLRYTYDLDSRDLGTDLIFANEGIYTVEFDWCPVEQFGINPPPRPAGTEVSWLSFQDGLGSTGFKIGAASAGNGGYTNLQITDSNGVSVVSPTYITPYAFSGVSLSFDTIANTFSVSIDNYNDGSVEIMHSGSFAGSMADFKRLEFWQKSETIKNYYDNFSMSYAVPEPTTAIYGLFATGFLLRRSRKRIHPKNDRCVTDREREPEPEAQSDFFKRE